MKNKEFTNVRKWVVNNLDNDPVRLFRRIYDNLYEFVDGSSIPHVVVVLGDYQSPVVRCSSVSTDEWFFPLVETEIFGGKGNHWPAGGISVRSGQNP